MGSSALRCNVQAVLMVKSLHEEGRLAYYTQPLQCTASPPALAPAQVSAWSCMANVVWGRGQGSPPRGSMWAVVCTCMSRGAHSTSRH